MGNGGPPSGLMIALCLLRVQPRRLRRGRFVEFDSQEVRAGETPPELIR